MLEVNKIFFWQFASVIFFFVNRCACIEVFYGWDKRPTYFTSIDHL